MKKIIKSILSDGIYRLHRIKLFHANIKVQTIDETIDELLNTNKSLVRFGDGEIVIIKGKNITLQKSSEEIAERLKKILMYENENLMVALHGGVYNIDNLIEQSQKFWKEHLLLCGNIYRKYCDPNKEYANACFSRFYFVFQDKMYCEKWIEKIKCIWKDKDIVIVEGIKSHNGVGNDLFENSRSIERIICPAQNAYDSYAEILKACQQYPKNRLILLSLGVTAKMLAEDLFLEGYRVIDIGNIDLEYEWYLRKETKKVFYKKYSLVTEDENREAGYIEYLSQIKHRIN